jgi:hypothetical protein
MIGSCQQADRPLGLAQLGLLRVEMVSDGTLTCLGAYRGGS